MPKMLCYARSRDRKQAPLEKCATEFMFPAEDAVPIKENGTKQVALKKMKDSQAK
jgi:hypothetical protein